MKTISTLVLLLLCCACCAWAGIGSHDAMFVGGTVTTVPEKTNGKTIIAEDNFSFEYKGGKLTIPYKQINALEYGQKAGRRVGMAVAISPLFLLSKKRHHYLTVSFTDEGNNQQAAVFELGKDVVKSTLAALESKTSAKVDYQDNEARKSAEGK
jgi:hypothetical protein